MPNGFCKLADMLPQYEPVTYRLKSLLENDSYLRSMMLYSLDCATLHNPDLTTNPVRLLDDLYRFLDIFLNSMPWQAVERFTGNKQTGSLFHRIDQSTGYFYYLFGELQYQPQIADWIKQYNTLWGEFLDSNESWNNEYYELLKQDPLFELDGNKYESPDKWHSWNDFFSRRLGTQSPSPAFIAEGKSFPWLPIQDNTLAIKTAKIDNITELLGNSPYKRAFENGSFMHITLDIFNYHRFHSPVSGRIVDIQDIDGVLSDGGKIIWDKAEHRYRYEQADNIGFQMIEKRIAIVIEPADAMQWHLPFSTPALQRIGLLAIIPIGVAQVGSIRLNDCIRTGAKIDKGQEIGYFLCGGSDVVVMSVQ